MKIELDIDEEIVKKYVRRLCGSRTCIGCEHYSERKEFCCNKNIEKSLSSSINNFLESSLNL